MFEHLRACSNSEFLVIVRHHIPASSRRKCWVGGVRMMQHRNRSGANVSMHHSNTSYEAFVPWRGWLWCLTGLENGKQELLWLATSLLVGHKSFTKRLVVESLSDIETSNFKALLTYHFLRVLVLYSLQIQSVPFTHCTMTLQPHIALGVWIQWNGMVDWNGGMDWNDGVLMIYMVLIGFHLLIMTTSEQKPSLNKEHLNFNCQIPFKYG